MIFESLQVLRKKWAVQHHQIQEIRAMTRSLGGCSNHIFLVLGSAHYEIFLKLRSEFVMGLGNPLELGGPFFA